MNLSDDIRNLSRNIYSKKSETCIATETPSCDITNDDINNMSSFIVDTIAKCSSTGITKEDIKNGKVLSKGSFGYGFLAGNKIIKIVVCNKGMKHQDKEALKVEIEIQKKLTLTEHSAFTKLLGYYVKDGNMYSYYDSKNNFQKAKNCNSVVIDNKICEIYLIIEAGLYDLGHYLKNPNICVVNNPVTSNMLNSFDKLLSFYKTSYDNKNIYENKIFVHCDIKLENIIEVANGDLKFIDFGLSIFINSFFKRRYAGTPYLFELLFTCDTNKGKIYNPELITVSPLYDIFCVLVSLFELLCCERFIQKYHDFNYVNNKIVNTINSLNINDSDLNKLISHYYLLCSIYLFHKKNVEYYINNNLNNLDDYDKLNDMRNFEIVKLFYSDKPIPEHVKMDNMNKNEEDILYLDAIMNYYYG